MQRPDARALLCVGGISASWVASTQLSQTLVSHGGEASGANFFLVWFSTSFNLLLVPALWGVDRASSGSLRLRDALRWGGVGLPLRRIGRAALVLYPLWVGANYLYVRALTLATAATVTAVFSTTPAVVAVLSRFVLREPFWPLKVAAVLLAVLGVLVVDLAPTLSAASDDPSDALTDPTDTIIAGGLTAVAALCAGSYKVLLRKQLGETTAAPIALYLAVLGALNVVGGGVVVLVLQLLGWESVQWASLPWCATPPTPPLIAVDRSRVRLVF